MPTDPISQQILQQFENRTNPTPLPINQEDWNEVVRDIARLHRKQLARIESLEDHVRLLWQHIEHQKETIESLRDENEKIVETFNVCKQKKRDEAKNHNRVMLSLQRAWSQFDSF